MSKSSFLLLRYGFFAIPLAFAGLPVYVHLPQYYSSEFGLNLTILGSILLAVRLIDGIQDPFLGWLVDRYHQHRLMFARLSAQMLAVSFFALFSGVPWLHDEVWIDAVWFGGFLILTSTAFSMLMILFYSQGVTLAEIVGGHKRVAGRRESLLFIGIIIAAILPEALQSEYSQRIAYMVYAGIFTLVMLASTLFSRPVWKLEAKHYNKKAEDKKSTKFSLKGFYSFLKIRDLRWLICIFCLNTLPVAITSTLFLFYVEDVLQMPDQAGILLGLFFLSAAFGAVIWTKLARKIGNFKVLFTSMSLGIIALCWAYSFETGDLYYFYGFCFIGGMAAGGDTAMLPAIFSRILEKSGENNVAKAFGLWNLISKTSLALAAGVLLPVLATYNYRPEADLVRESKQAIEVLIIAYTLLPAGLKLLALTTFTISPLGKKYDKIRG